jgi:hypothetical protein
MNFNIDSKQPNLVTNDVEIAYDELIVKNTTGMTISEKITDQIYELYIAYVYEHKFVVFCLVFAVVFLIYRYYKNKEEKQENYADSYELKNYVDCQRNKLYYNEQPYINNLRSVDDQPFKEKVNYPPMSIPMNLNPNDHRGYGYNIVETKNMYPDPASYDIIKTPANLYGSGVDYYTGVNNTYLNAQDTDLINSMGYPNNFNSSTGEFISGFTDKNNQNMIDYNKIVDAQNYVYKPYDE